MRVLIVTQQATIGTGMKLVVDGHATKIQVLVIQTLEDGAIDWTSKEGEPITLPEAIDEAQVIIISHPNSDVVTEVRDQSGDKIVFGVFTEFPIPISSMPLNLFREMWPQIAEALQAKLRADS